MLKVNRRKEIKEKEDFQLKFQLALSSNNQNVQNWLPTSNELTHSEKLDDDKDLFFDLPVISNGAGLFELESAGGKNAISTIGSFLGSENMPKKVETKSARDIRTGSKAMSALMNKMRADTRKNVTEKYQVNKDRPNHRPRLKIMEDLKKQKQSLKNEHVDRFETHESDEEESKMNQITGKKNQVPQFGKKIKGRPF